MSQIHNRRPRRRFTDDFKQQAVLDAGNRVTAVARELDLTPSGLALWVKRAQADRTKARTGLTWTEREELTRLRRENRILQEEREILTEGSCLGETPAPAMKVVASQGVSRPGGGRRLLVHPARKKGDPSAATEAPRIVAPAGRLAGSHAR